MIKTNSSYEKIKSILEHDSGRKSSNISEVIKSDLYNVLKSYFDIEPCNLAIDIEQNGDIFTIKFLAHAKNIKGLNYLR